MEDGRSPVADATAADAAHEELPFTEGAEGNIRSVVKDAVAAAEAGDVPAAESGGVSAAGGGGARRGRSMRGGISNPGKQTGKQSEGQSDTAPAPTGGPDGIGPVDMPETADSALRAVLGNPETKAELIDKLNVLLMVRIMKGQVPQPDAVLSDISFDEDGVALLRLSDGVVLKVSHEENATGGLSWAAEDVSSPVEGQGGGAGGPKKTLSFSAALSYVGLWIDTRRFTILEVAMRRARRKVAGYARTIGEGSVAISEDVIEVFAGVVAVGMFSREGCWVSGRMKFKWGEVERGVSDDTITSELVKKCTRDLVDVDRVGIFAETLQMSSELVQLASFALMKLLHESVMTARKHILPSQDGMMLDAILSRSIKTRQEASLTFHFWQLHPRVNSTSVTFIGTTLRGHEVNKEFTKDAPDGIFPGVDEFATAYETYVTMLRDGYTYDLRDFCTHVNSIKEYLQELMQRSIEHDFDQYPIERILYDGYYDKGGRKEITGKDLDDLTSYLTENNATGVFLRYFDGQIRHRITFYEALLDKDPEFLLKFMNDIETDTAAVSSYKGAHTGDNDNSIRLEILMKAIIGKARVSVEGLDDYASKLREVYCKHRSILGLQRMDTEAIHKAALVVFKSIMPWGCNIVGRDRHTDTKRLMFAWLTLVKHSEGVDVRGELRKVVGYMTETTSSKGWFSRALKHTRFYAFFEKGPDDIRNFTYQQLMAPEQAYQNQRIIDAAGEEAASGTYVSPEYCLKSLDTFETEMASYAEAVSVTDDFDFTEAAVTISTESETNEGKDILRQKLLRESICYGETVSGCVKGGDCLSLYSFDNDSIPQNVKKIPGVMFRNPLMYFSVLLTEKETRKSKPHQCMCAAHILATRLGRTSSDLPASGLYDRYTFNDRKSEPRPFFLTIFGNPWYTRTKWREILYAEEDLENRTRTGNHEEQNVTEDEIGLHVLEDERVPGTSKVGGSSDGSALSFLSIAFLGAVTVAASLCKRG